MRTADRTRIRVACAIFLALPFTICAEGRCPPGQYPIGGNGVLGCAPIPGAGSQPKQRAPRPTGVWETRWGAIAEDRVVAPPGGRHPTGLGGMHPTGIAESMKSKRKAEAAAIRVCRERGGQDCFVRFSYYNQCAALADADFGGTAPPGVSSGARAPHKQQAEAMAQRACEEGSPGRTCRVVYSGCSMSEFRRY